MNPNDYLEIYRAYPRHVARRDALLKIQRAILRLEGGEAGRRMMYEDAVLYLLEATVEFARSPAGQRGQMTCHPSTFYHQSRYLDDRAEWQTLRREEEQAQRMQAEANVGVFRP